jgi:ribosomal protein L25 (general stress protein Ctc)
MYKVPALTGYGPTSIRVSGRDVIIRARARVARKTGSPPYEIYAHKTVTVHVA